ncbi:hypothetical protein IC620_12380 [Hazenella sp. IB182357]|uniref:Uncharacterized protein n=1 Tax=Polycladospora coralii TaxID=2771432 RepID=A0A926NBG4_9BACL|nr:glycosyltransferase [Polycladospora coralii]MBD1373152.1 hypothetical protein [Polycladospora coralii]
MGFGTGHNAAAHAIQSHLHTSTQVEAVTQDILELIPGTLHPLLQSGYHGMLSKFPSIYHVLYDWTHQSRVVRYVSSELIEKIGWTVRKKMMEIFTKVNPTRIITTHPFGLMVCPSAYQCLPTVAVVTDYELHPIWLTKTPNVLCTPKKLISPMQTDQIQWQTGITLHETGIPIRATFYQPIDRKSAREKLGLKPNPPVVLIMGGGTGMGPLEQLVSELRPLIDVQFIVLTGNNINLYHRLKSKYTYDHIQFEGFRSDMEYWMAAADLLVTKPGGITVSEAIAKQLPMFLFEAFPGQEEANQQYLIKNRVAFLTRPATIRVQIEKFFSYTRKNGKFEARFQALLSQDATTQIVEQTLQLPIPKETTIQV